MSKDVVKSIHISRYDKGEITSIQDPVLCEAHYRLYVNQSFVDTLVCTKMHLEELVTGHLYCIGTISEANQIKSVRIEESTGEIHVTTHVATLERNANGLPIAYRWVPEVDCEALSTIFSQFNEKSALFLSTGAVHSAALLDKSYNTLFFAEDMGRHNAVDKVIGWGLTHHINFSATILMTSSRMPLELLKKASGAGIGFVASISAPTFQSVEFARENNMTLIGMFRKGRFNLYHVKED